jgi:WD40 repeat protein
VTLWDTATGEELRRFTGHTSPIERLGFSADGRHLFSFSAGSARVWDIVTDINQPRRVDLRVDSFSRFALSPDGQNLYVAYNDQSLSTWDMLTGGERQGLDFFTGQQNVVAFSPTQPLALVNGPEGTILWDLAREERVTRLEGIDSVTGIAFSSDGRDAALATSSGILIWNVESQGSSLRWSISGVNHLALYFNQLIAASQPDRIVIYDAIARSTLEELTGFSGQINAIAFSPAGDRVIAAVGEPDNAVILWDVQTGSRIFTMVGHNDNVNTVAFSPDGRTAVSGSDDTTLILWDVETGQSVTRLRGHTAPVRSVVFSTDGRSVLSSSDNAEEDILIWPVGTVQDTVNWVYNNRYVLPLDCDQRQQYGVRPACVDGIAPTLTPTFTPQATFTPTATSTLRPTFTPSPTPIPTARLVASSQVRLRTGPSQNFDIITQVQPGITVQVLEYTEDRGWALIRLLDGTEGWVSSDFLDT